jgi:hypothetical protein
MKPILERAEVFEHGKTVSVTAILNDDKDGSSWRGIGIASIDGKTIHSYDDAVRAAGAAATTHAIEQALFSKTPSSAHIRHLRELASQRNISSDELRMIIDSVGGCDVDDKISRVIQRIAGAAPHLYKDDPGHPVAVARAAVTAKAPEPAQPVQKEPAEQAPPVAQQRPYRTFTPGFDSEERKADEVLAEVTDHAPVQWPAPIPPGANGMDGTTDFEKDFPGERVPNVTAGGRKVIVQPPLYERMRRKTGRVARPNTEGW